MITASVVLHNTPVEDVKNIIESYSPSEDRLLFIYDNSETDHSRYEFVRSIKAVEYARSEKNIGYGAANNLGIRRAKELNSDYHIVMNPDLRFDPSVIGKLTEYADSHPETVYLMPQIIDCEGVIQPLCKLLPKPSDLIIRRFLPIIGPLKKEHDRYVLAEYGYNRVINPPCLSGCFMFMRTADLKRHKLEFDERFFLYCEDFDLIRRLHRIGKTEYLPFVSVVHRQMKESYHSPAMLAVHIVSACKYFNKYGWFIDKERDEMNSAILKEIQSRN